MKSFTRSAKQFLIQKLNISSKEAISVIASKRLLINGKNAGVNQPITITDNVELDGKTLQAGEKFIYMAYYKPRGIECTLNPDIPDNLCHALNIQEHVFPAGRLDKDSEGLLLLTNDGFIFNKIIHSNRYQEKEYIVSVDKPLSDEDINKLSNGIEIMGVKTRPAKVTRLSPTSFNIILTQGLNRQIRRMCFKLGYMVTELKRIRIINIELTNLSAGEYRNLTLDELDQLRLLVD